MKKLKIKKINEIESQCELGEGLCIDKDYVLWVDINRPSLFIYRDNKLKKNILPHCLTAIQKIEKKSITAMCAVGEVKVNLDDFNCDIKEWKGLEHDIKNYRTNDACIKDDVQLIGFMHKNNPENNNGYIYKYHNGQMNLIDDQIKVPNTFINLYKNNFLISDTKERKVWKYIFDDKFNLIKKELWKYYEEGASPDGGCIVHNMVLITLCKKSCISVLNKNGDELQRLAVEVPRPSNCKFNISTNELWLTSAKEKMSTEDIKKYPTSGNTFCYRVSFS